METQKYNITGMNCAACSARVEKAVMKVDGVDECRVNLLTNSMTVVGDADKAKIVAAVTAAGYGAVPSGGMYSNKEKAGNTEKGILKRRFFLSLSLLIVLMYISMGHEMLNLPVLPVMERSRVAVGIAQFLLSAAVMIINGRFFISGAKSAFHLAPNMDTLVSLGSLSSFVYSTAVLYKTIITPGFYGNFYFESAAMILTLITLGKMLEAGAKGNAAQAIEALKKLAPQTAVLIKDGVQKTVKAAEILQDDIIAVRPGESIAVDGIVTDGFGTVDESALTGESVPSEKVKGMRVFSGTLNLSGYFEFRATAVGGETALSKIIETVSCAAADKVPVAKIADKIAGVFVPVVLFISAMTACIWLLLEYEFAVALTRAVSVLVISCPCALGLAAPVAVMVASGVGAKNGILFKSAAAIEQAAKTDVVMLDKTGTVTVGEPVVTDVFSTEDKQELLSIAMSLEEKSEHPLAKAVVNYCHENGAENIYVYGFENFAGGGVRGKAGSFNVAAGSVKFISGGAEISARTAQKADEYAALGKTPVLFQKGETVLGIMAISDRIKPEANASIAALKRFGKRVIMLTGDNSLTARNIAKSVGIQEVFAGLLPNDKADKIKELQKRHKVVMVGDGINDAPALTSADTGVAIGTGADIAIDSADIVLLGSSLEDLVSALALSRAAYRNIKENLFWAFFYNVICIPAAAGAFFFFFLSFSPMTAAAAMSLSSLFVVSNALRLKFFKPYKASKLTEEDEMKNIKIEGIMCAHCENRIKKALEAVKGVQSADVSHKSGIAKVILDCEVADKTLIAAIENEGYKVIEIE